MFDSITSRFKLVGPEGAAEAPGLDSTSAGNLPVRTILFRPFGADDHFRGIGNPGLRFACPGLEDVSALRA